VFPPPPLGPEQLEIVERAAAVSRECLRPQAARIDEEAVFPFENYRDLHAAGLVALLVPTAYGGLGADPLTYAAVLLELAKGDSSTALTFNMHSTHIRTLEKVASEEQRRRYFGEIVRDGKLLASITSEPGSTFRAKYVIRMRFHPTDGGYQVKGVKHFCSVSDGAEYLVTSGMLEGVETAAEGLLTAMIPAKSPGIELVGRWNATGMRGTASHTLGFDTFVPHDAVLGGPGALMQADVLNFALGYGAVYLGIGQAAFEYTVEQIMAKAARGETASLDSPLVQASIGDLATRILAARSLLWVAGQAKAAEAPNAAVTVNQAKAFCSEVGLWATEQCLRLAGGRGILKEQPLERWHRDALPGVVMPPANERVLEVSGKAFLGQPSAAIEFQ
jgi:alkylation response protein AidB-like acyl-CoA dehydrogenase